MISIEDINAQSQIKVKTRDLERYKIIDEKDVNNFYPRNRSEQMLLAFSIGVRAGYKIPINKGVAFVNVANIPREIKEFYVRVINIIHKDVETVEEFWECVEQYAEYGIDYIANNIKKNKGIILFEDLETDDSTIH